MKEFLLEVIKHERYKKLVFEWLFLDVPERNARVYYKPEGEIGQGFSFYALELESVYAGSEDWDPVSTGVSCLFNGYAYFDGIRHLYTGDEQTDNYGYHYYANLSTHIETLKIIRDLEEKYCRDKFNTDKNN